MMPGRLLPTQKLIMKENMMPGRLLPTQKLIMKENMMPERDQHTPRQALEKAMTPMVEVMESLEPELHQLQQHQVVEEVVEEVGVEEAVVDQVILEDQCPLLGIIGQQLLEELLDPLVGVDEVEVEEGVEEVVEGLQQGGL
jgi:hypothetical protein